MILIYKFLAIVYKIFKYSNRKVKIKKALSDGLVLGEGTRLVGDIEFSTEPFLISIGNNCLITDGVKFITHNGGVQVPYIKRGAKIEDIYANKVLAGKIVIGSNVFIGSNSLILHNSVIGDNVMIGAGSVVKGNFPSDVVIAGVPAKIICSIEDYEEKIKSDIVSIVDKSRRIDEIKKKFQVE